MSEPSGEDRDRSMRDPHLSLKSRLDSGEAVVGCLLPYNAPWLVEMFALAGFDYVAIDLEHEAFNDESVTDLIRSSDGAGISCIVRAPYSDRLHPFLAAGAHGVQVPQIEGSAHARTVVGSLRPYPEGRRAYYMQGRAAHYGLGIDESEALARLNEDFLLIGMIESVEAVHVLDDILAVQGLDAIHIGPLDLAQSMSFPSHEKVRSVILDVVDRCLTAKKHVSVGVVTPSGVDELGFWLERGVRIFTVATAWVLASAISEFHVRISTEIPASLRTARSRGNVPHNVYLSGPPRRGTLQAPRRT